VSGQTPKPVAASEQGSSAGRSERCSPVGVRDVVGWEDGWAGVGEGSERPLAERGAAGALRAACVCARGSEAELVETSVAVPFAPRALSAHLQWGCARGVRAERFRGCGKRRQVGDVDDWTGGWVGCWAWDATATER
jgi:hypothetical protein